MRSSVVIPAAVALTAAGVLALWNALASKSARRRLRRDATLVQVGDRSVHVEDTPASGRGAGRDFTVVLDAGLGMSSLSWSWVRDSITRSGVRVVTFDRPGLGRSPAQSGVPWLRRVDVLVEQMHEVLEKVGANKKLVLVGHSSSGMHVRLFAHRYPKQVAGLVLVDAANEQQLGHLEGSSVYNSYPPAQVTEAKLGRLKRLWHSGLLRIMYLCSGPAFEEKAWDFPPLKTLQRILDRFGRAAAVEVRQTEKMLLPHFREDRRAQFHDEQFCLEGMSAMLAEHGSQRASMEYMQTQDLLRPGTLSDLPIMVVSRDPEVGAGGGLYENARGNQNREEVHARMQHQLAGLSSNARVHVVGGAGHGSLLFVRDHASQTAEAVLEVVSAAGERRRLSKMLT